MTLKGYSIVHSPAIDNSEALGMRIRGHGMVLAHERSYDLVLRQLQDVEASTSAAKSLPHDTLLGQWRRVDQALKYRVHEASVAQVDQARPLRHKSRRGHQVTPQI